MKQQDYIKELTPEVREQMKRNLVYVSIFSIIMCFAGFCSGYIVSSGGSFWVKYNFPPAFYISTGFIVLSSIVLQVFVARVKKGNAKAIKIGVLATFLLGVGFAYFQMQGYKQLVKSGAFLNSNIMVSEGRYGDYYSIRYHDLYMEVDGNEYYLAGKKMSEAQKEEISKFGASLDTVAVHSKFHGPWNKNIELLYKSQIVTFKNDKFYVQDTVELQFVDLDRLEKFAVHMRDKRGDFFHQGEYGKDFLIYYEGTPLEYKNRILYHNGIKLDAPLQMSMNGSKDTATSYLYIITFLHLLHILVTLIFMLSLSIRSFTGTLERYNYISLRMGSIFWHFLGVLWIALLLFLLFIH